MVTKRLRDSDNTGTYGLYPVRFGGVISLRENEQRFRAVFENPAHDFPTRIVYEREGEILSARIEGEMEGRPVSMGWRFRSAELNSRCPN